MKSCCLVRNSEDTVTLYFTDAAHHDCQQGIVRSAAHSLAAHYTHVWMCDDSSGVPVYSERGLLRAIIRMLKGHGVTYHTPVFIYYFHLKFARYAIPDNTWHYYKTKKLSPIAIFKVLRNFDSKKENLERAYQHLIDLGLVVPGTRAIDAWGEALWFLNHKMGRYGMKFNLSPQTPEEVDIWCDRKKADVAEWLRSRKANAQKTGFLEADEEAEVILPHSLQSFNRYMYDYSNLTSYSPPEPERRSLKRPDALNSKVGVGRAISRIMRTNTLRDISGAFANYLQDPLQRSSSTTSSQAEDDPLVVVDRFHSGNTLRDRASSFASADKQAVRDVYIDPVPHQKLASQLARLLTLLQFDWPVMISGVLLLLSRLGLAIYLPYLLLKNYLEGHIIESFLQNDISKLQADVILLTEVTVAEIALFFLSSLVLQLLSVRIMTIFTKQVFSSVLLQEHLHTHKMRTGDKMARINDAMALKSVFATDFPLLIEGAVHAVGSLSAAIILHFWLGTITTCAVLSVFGCTIGYGFIGKARSCEIRTIVAKIYRKSYGCFANLRAVYGQGCEKSEISSYAWLMEGMYAQVRKLNAFHALFYSYATAAAMMCKLALLWVSVGMVLRGAISPGDVMTQLFLAELAMIGATFFFQAYGNLLGVIGSTERLFHVMYLISLCLTNSSLKIQRSSEAEIDERITHNPLRPHASARLEFTATVPLSAEFSPLERVSFVAQPGKILAITGKSDFDKKGIMQVLHRFHRPDDAVVFLDDVDVYTLNLYWYRKQIGFLEQDVDLFNGSVAYNIAYGCEKVTMKQIVQAATTTGAHSFIASLQDGYMTAVGEHGVYLSTTQKMKLALARLLLSTPRIVVFDVDFLVDVETDQEFQVCVLDIMAKMAKARVTVIILTHKEFFAKAADAVCHVGNRPRSQ